MHARCAQGLLEGISPELDLALGAGSAGKVSAAGAPRQYGASSSAVGQALDHGGMEQCVFLFLLRFSAAGARALTCSSLCSQVPHA